LWKAFHDHTDPKSTRDALKLGRPDAGWYQIRTALGVRNGAGGYPPASFDAFDAAYTALTEKLQPMVFSLGFLRP
jgi:hypothetical protein